MSVNQMFEVVNFDSAPVTKEGFQYFAPQWDPSTTTHFIIRHEFAAWLSIYTLWFCWKAFVA